MTDNPYAAPKANINPVGTEYETTRREHLNTEASVKAVGTIYLLGGSMLVLGSLISLAGATTVRDTYMLGLTALMIALGVLQIMFGFGLRRLKRWARIAGTVMTAIGLIEFPFGTLISAYVLYLMWGAKGRRVFQPDYLDIVAATPHLKYKTSIVVWILLGLILMLVAAAILVPVFR